MAYEHLISNDYIRSFVILVVLLFLIRLGLFIVERVVLKFTSKTKTDLDDILVKRLSKPLTYWAFFVSLRISVEELRIVDPAVESVVLNSIHSLIIFVIAYIIYIIIDVLIVRAVRRVASKTKSAVDDNLISLFHSITRVALIVVSLLYALSIWGVQITPLLAGLGIAGLAVALALQPLLSNIFSGAAMVMDHSIRVNDLVYLDANTKGRVEKVGLRATRIRTFDNELLIIPNNKLAESTIQNVALPEPKVRVVVPFSVAYGSNIDKVKKLILSEINKVSHLEKEPEPMVRFLEMANSSLNFKAYFYVDSFENRFLAIDEANTKIYNALNKAGISIPFPQIDVHLKKD